jgi:hypothetical protein
MEMFKSLVNLKDAQQVVTQVSEGVNIEIYGNIKVVKGDFEAILEYYAKVYRRGDSNYLTLDDWDISNSKYSFAGLPIDNIDAFINGFGQHGMQSVSQYFVIDTKNALLQSLSTNTVVKKHFGKNCKAWDLLSTEEQKNYYVELMKKGDTVAPYTIKQMGWVDSEGNPLTTEQILESEEVKTK